MSLFVWWYADLAFSLRAKLRLQAIPWASSRSALARDDQLSLLVKDPGTLELFPNTSISGENPFLRLNVFLAWVLCANACWRSSKLLISRSWSILSSIVWRTWPWRSHRPFGQWACGAMVTGFTLCLRRNSTNSSLVNSVTESVTNVVAGPAHWNHASDTFRVASSAARLGAGTTTWKFVAWSNMW